MGVRTPMTLITGPLGSGKTTLLRHILTSLNRKIAILMNEFGEISIDGKIIQGKEVQITELGGGCVCCSLQGEFEAAVKEILQVVTPGSHRRRDDRACRAGGPDLRRGREPE